jgi:hypothetical protein
MVATLLVQSGTSWDLRSLISYPISATFLILFWLFWLAVILVPFGKLLTRTGHSAAWCLVFIIPFVNLIALWVFAFKHWPTNTSNS